MIRNLEKKDKETWNKLYNKYADFYKVPMNKNILNTLWGWIHDKTHVVRGVCFGYESTKYRIEVLGEKVDVEFSKSHLKDLIDTLIQNAKQHSFKKERKGQKIIFKVKPDFKRNLVVLEYLNNGEPLEITQKEYISILTKSKSSKGSGIGGYYINKIIQAHGGLLKISEGFKKGFRMKIEIPIEQNKELNE